MNDSLILNGNLILNDNGAWCWFQDERALYDPVADTLLVGSVAADDGPGGDTRAGNVELAIFDLSTGTTTVVILHEQLEADDHNVPALWQRPDGRYLAMYAKHKSDNLSRWRISTHPHDATSWRPEQTFDWTELTGGRGATYSNLHYLADEGRLYNFVRSVNDDPSLMISEDFGDTWSYGGKLLTEPKIGYVNGYTRYAGNGRDRIDFITTDHHPRDFNNNIYHGYLAGGALHRADGVVTDPSVLGGDGTSQTLLTTVLAASPLPEPSAPLPEAVEGPSEPMTHAWTCDIRHNERGELAAILSCRANDVPENSNFDDHRFWYARFDGTQWRTHQLAKAGPALWADEQDYTGLGVVDPSDLDTIYLSTPIDPRTGDSLDHHEIFRGRLLDPLADGGAHWEWTAITEQSPVDNLRPIIAPAGSNRSVLLWFRGTMTRSQHYNSEVVARILS